MKILLLSSAGVLGGAERVLLDAAASLRTLHPAWQFSLIAPADGDLVEQGRELGIPTLVRPFSAALATLGDAGDGPSVPARLRTIGRLGISSPGVARYVRSLGREIEYFDPDLIHANGFKMHLLGARAKTTKAALLWHLHDFVQSRTMVPLMLRMHLTQTAAIVVNSNSVAADARAALGTNIPVYTVYNGIDLERFSPDGETADLDALAGIASADHGVVRIGLIATAARWKGHEVFLQALAQMRDDLPFRAYVIGGPIYQTAGSQFTLDELRAMAIRLRIANKVGFTGHLRELAPALRALDVVAHCSTAPEPFGLVIAEALATGRALITSAQGGAAELVTAERDALFYSTHDPASLAAGLERLVTNPALRKSLGCAGRMTAERRFSRERLGAELSAIYHDLVPAEGPRDDAATARP